MACTLFIMTKPEAYSEPTRTSKMCFLAKIVNGLESLTIFAKSSISDVRLGSEYGSASSSKFLIYKYNSKFIWLL